MANVEVGTVLPKLVDSNPQGLPVYKRDGYKVQEISHYLASGVAHPKDEIFLKDLSSGEIASMRRVYFEAALDEAQKGIMRPEGANSKRNRAEEKRISSLAQTIQALLEKRKSSDRYDGLSVFDVLKIVEAADILAALILSADTEVVVTE